MLKLFIQYIGWLITCMCCMSVLSCDMWLESIHKIPTNYDYTKTVCIIFVLIVGGIGLMRIGLMRIGLMRIFDCYCATSDKLPII
jgi:hypothetical protein